MGRTVRPNRYGRSIAVWRSGYGPLKVSCPGLPPTSAFHSISCVSTAGVRGADPDALAELARALDGMADSIGQVAGWLRAVAGQLAAIPAIDRLAEVVQW